MRKKMVSILAGLAVVILVLAIHGVHQPNYFQTKTVWFGGLPGDDRKLENMTLNQISSRANELTSIYGEPVEFKSEEGRMVYQAYARGYEKSKCLGIHEKAWQGGKLIINEAKKVCDLLHYNSVGLSGYPDTVVDVYPHAFP